MGHSHRSDIVLVRRCGSGGVQRRFHLFKGRFYNPPCFLGVSHEIRLPWVWALQRSGHPDPFQNALFPRVHPLRRRLLVRVRRFLGHRCGHPRESTDQKDRCDWFGISFHRSIVVIFSFVKISALQILRRFNPVNVPIRHNLDTFLRHHHQRSTPPRTGSVPIIDIGQGQAGWVGSGQPCPTGSIEAARGPYGP